MTKPFQCQKVEFTMTFRTSLFIYHMSNVSPITQTARFGFKIYTPNIDQCSLLPSSRSGARLAAQSIYHLKQELQFVIKQICQISPAIKERADRIIAMLLERNLISISKFPWSRRVLFVENAAEEELIK